ncbi:MAG: hypothetical protein QXQ14_03595 [Candidatus Aenigmatarchaeota archaeon]
MNFKTKEIITKGIKIYLEKDGKEIARCCIYLIYNDLHERPYALLEDVFVDENFRNEGKRNWFRINKESY